ncbi:MAG TPA: amidohydrolase family protein [Acidimicrobiales bacterium]|nr:amidohydrolase family protein [Acidimicrobiales bacterium]
MALDLVIDADTHLTEPPDVWTSRVPARYVEHVPRMVRNDAGRDVWVVDDQHLSTVGNTAVAGWPRPFPDAPPTLEDCPLAAYDAAARVKMMDELGIWAQVMYPNVAGFGSQRFLQLRDDELKLVCVRAYNDFLRDWASEAPERLITIMSVPFWDIDAAVAEVERCATAGHRGILFTGEPQRFGLPFLGEHHWDPLWSVAQDTGLPIHFHIGSGDTSSSYTPERAAAHGTAATNAYSSIEMFLKNGLQVADLITSGVLPRFPTLQFVSVESGIGWIPFVLEAADHGYLAARLNRECEWDMLPSEYFRRQVYACYWFERAAPAHLLGEIPVDRILFETDFPHPTCLYGNVREQIDASLAAATPDARRKILWDNAAALYRIEAPKTVDA